MVRLSPGEIKLIKEVMATSGKELFEAIKVEDQKEKQGILEQIELFKRLYFKDNLETTKETVNLLYDYLNLVNDRIQRLRQ